MREPTSDSEYRAYVRGQIQSLTETLTKVMFGDFTAVARTPEPDEAFGYLCAMVNVAINAARNAQDELLRANVLLQAEVAERQRAEQEVRERQELLQTITDNAAAVIYVKDLEGRYLMVNRRFSELFHIRREDAISKTDHDLFAADMADSFRAMDQRVVAAGQALVEEEVAPHDDGPHTYVSVKCPLRGQHGRIHGVFGISTDITDRKRAEEALRDSEAQTRSIVDTALDAVVTMDGEGIITGWNRQAEATFGWTSEEAVGRSLSETIIPPGYRDSHLLGLHRYLATGEATILGKRLELSALHRDGHEFPVELAITPIGTEQQRAFSGFVRDISERKLAQSRLQAQLERLNLLDQVTCAIGERQDLASIYQVTLQSLEEHLPADFSCVLSYDADADALAVSHIGGGSWTLATQLGLGERSRIQVDSNGLARCALGHLVHEPDTAAAAFNFPQLLAKGGLRSLIMAPLQFDGRVAAILLVARREAHSFSSGECEFLRQLSAHVALAAQQAQLYGALEQAYNDILQTQQAVMQQERLRALGQMASGIAHDINNALTPAILSTEYLLETEPDLSPDARESLETIQRAVDDIAGTVSRMKEFYRQREPASALLPVQLNPVVQQVIDLTRARWSDMPQQRGIVIEMRTELAQDLPVVMGVESEIREALVNLVFNAVDAMPDGGILTVRTCSCEAPDRHAAIEVADTGLGMDEATRRRCLEPFFTTKGERGTGLGLPMVYGIVERHGADLNIDSRVGSGTTIAVHFPAQESVAAGTLPADEPPHGKPGQLRILVVDDDPLLLRSLQRILESDGHVVIAANGGQAGIDAFHAAQKGGDDLSIVITDLGMPHVDGRRLAAAVKAASPSIPVILLTGWGQRLLAEDDVPDHVDQLLSKPPKLRELREALARHGMPEKGA
jgi:PAS domain S-box-containing protein